MGLGLLGRGIGYTKFLADCGTQLLVTDLKDKKQLAPSLKKLAKYKNIKYVLGKHRLEDFRNCDMVIKAAGVPLDSPYIKEAKKNKIPVEMDVSLFAKLAPDVTIIGITGTRGKSMTTMLIYDILQNNKINSNVYLGGNVRGVATLPLLARVKSGDVLVAELDSWQLQGFGVARISPHVAVFTSFMTDHMNYYRKGSTTMPAAMRKYFADKANIFKYQKPGDLLVIGETMRGKIKKSDTRADLVLARTADVAEFSFTPPGVHNRANMACAVAVARHFCIPDSAIRKSVKNFQGVEGRLQLLRTYKGIKIYNDNNATTPEAAIAGLKAVADSGKNIVLITGGATKKVPLGDYVKAINKYPAKVCLIPGTGTDELLQNKIKTEIFQAKDFRSAVTEAVKSAKKDDTILFSPAFASFGLFNNEYERNDLFVSLVKKLK